MTDGKRGKLRALLPRVAVVAGIATAVFLVIRFTPLSLSDITPSSIKGFILGFGVWGPIIFVAMYASRAVVLVIPVGIMSLAGGLAYGQWRGTALIMVGAVLGSCLAFLLARYVGRNFVERFEWLHKGRIGAFDEGTETHGLRIIIMARLLPLFQYDAVNYGAGLSRMKFRDFALGSLIGMLPGGFINATLGSSLTNIASFQFVLAVVAFVLLMLAPVIYKTVKRRRDARHERTT